MPSIQETDCSTSRQTPVILKNSGWEWCAGVALCAAFFGFMWAYHDWWRGKTYTWGTANEACALAGLYGIAFAYSLGPLFRWKWLNVGVLRYRRPVGVVAVGFGMLHMILTFFPLSGKYGWTYFVKHWITLVLGIFAAVCLLVLAAISVRQAAVRIGLETWRRIQRWGLVLLPLIVVHYVALGKMAKWAEWFGGKDTHPAPPGTFVGAVIVLLVLMLRGVDWGVTAKRTRLGS